MSDETAEQRARRERRDGELIERLLQQPLFPAGQFPHQRTIRIGLPDPERTQDHLYSPAWLLCYEQARHAGVSCRYRSAYYANDRVFPFNHEYHDHFFSPEWEAQILYQALKWRVEHGQTKPKKINGKERTENERTGNRIPGAAALRAD